MSESKASGTVLAIVRRFARTILRPQVDNLAEYSLLAEQPKRDKMTSTNKYEVFTRNIDGGVKAKAAFGGEAICGMTASNRLMICNPRRIYWLQEASLIAKTNLFQALKSSLSRLSTNLSVI